MQTIMNLYTDDLLDRALAAGEARLTPVKRDAWGTYYFNANMGDRSWRQTAKKSVVDVTLTRSYFLVAFALEALGYTPEQAFKAVPMNRCGDARAALLSVLEG